MATTRPMTTQRVPLLTRDARRDPNPHLAALVVVEPASGEALAEAFDRIWEDHGLDAADAYLDSMRALAELRGFVDARGRQTAAGKRAQARRP